MALRQGKNKKYLNKTKITMDVEEQIDHLEREVHNPLFIIIYVDNYLTVSCSLVSAST